jgi:hypothetical protein
MSFCLHRSQAGVPNPTFRYAGGVEELHTPTGRQIADRTRRPYNLPQDSPSDPKTAKLL